MTTRLDSLKTESGKVALEINVKKTEQMRLNKPANLSTVDHLVINDQPINKVDDFKYIGSYGYIGTQVNTEITETKAKSQNSPF